MLSFTLEKFQGPLDVLLHLISKHKLDINDIPIVQLLEQYLKYIENMAVQDMEVAGEFLEMAARLIYIKTVALLPQHEEADVLKKELEGKLIEYALCKEAALRLRALYKGGSIFVRVPMKIVFDNTYLLFHDPMVLLDAYTGFAARMQEKAPMKAAEFSSIVSKKVVSVTSKIIYVLRRLYTSGTVAMNMLFDGMTDRSERVATFLAILELTKSGRVFISDDNSEITFNRERKVEETFTEETFAEEITVAQ